MRGSFDLTGRIAFVAGGAGYLGFPVCKALQKHGASVVVADHNKERLDATIKELRDVSFPGSATGLRFDISEPEAITHAIAETVRRFGRLDILINAAFTNAGAALEELQPDAMDRANRVNITGAFLLAREAARAMEDGGSIIMYASMYGMVAPDPRVYSPPMKPNPIEYGAGKAAVMQMVRYLAAFYGPRKIRVNAIAPGPFPNDSGQEAHAAFVGRLAQRTMLGRVGMQHETAGAAVFLASDAASYVTGHVLVVDGGWTTW